MLKKIVIGTLFIGLIGILIYGAVLRTNAKTSNDESGSGQGTGLGRGRANNAVVADASVTYGQGQGQGQGQKQGTSDAGQGQNASGSGQGRGQAARAASEQPVDVPETDRVTEWQIVEGTVISAGEQALVVELTDGSQLLVEGQPWVYAQSQAFMPQANDQVVLTVFEEDDELKAGHIDNTSNGETITLRLEDGKPMWSASLQNGQGSTGGSGQGQGSGSEGQGQGQGQGGGSQGQGQGKNQNAASVEQDQGVGQGQGQGQGRGNCGNGRGNATGGQTAVEITGTDWLALEGVAITVNSSELVIETGSGEQVLVEGRAWAYALEQAFAAQVGDSITVMGYVEDGEFKAGSVENTTTGQQIAVRDASGRPLWSGGGRGGA
jgi:hypothetical protein